ncbi:hypothetical protein DPMN_162089 [Dreissena polymorpha]|uniref:PAN-3 domain-containing protein n=1 Tax=Dreissena polymorpha TaxID=45954 RepID=A0A9D4EPP8_DREPO|nr:hypothetical protein DPMN_162089 [Dreissena polymorpha]
MNLKVYLFAVFLIAVKEIQGLKKYKFLSGNPNVDKVCAVNYRVFTKVGVSSTTECATECSKTNGCDLLFVRERFLHMMQNTNRSVISIGGVNSKRVLSVG